MTFLDVTLGKRMPTVEQKEIAKPRYDWCYENNIQNGKEKLDLENQEHKYSQWRTNSTLSNTLELLFYADEMNRHHGVTDQMHYDYMFYGIRKKRRWSPKKSEKEKEQEKLEKDQAKKKEVLIHLIQDYYKYNVTRAKEALTILSD